MRLLTTFLSIWLLLILAIALPAQEALQKPLPLDPAVRTGTLDNGLSYYLRQNAKPENRVELRLAVKAGSILEDEDQQGLAHFLEHMAFNGSKNFKKNELVDYLQTIGVKFGPDLNAYTSFDETVYMLLVPTDSAEILNTALQVLEDWAHQITMDHEEIDKERGVVIEEWRIGRGADERMRQQWFPVAYEGSRYAERLPIGKKEVLDTFGYETLKRFYYDWYRPGLMGIVAVGDIDLDEMEAKIKAQFSGIPPDETPRERTKYGVPILGKNTVTVTADPENAFTRIMLMHKKEPLPLKTEADYRRKMVYDAFTGMLRNRLNELRESPEPPFFTAFASYGPGFGDAIDNYQLFAVVGAEGIMPGLQAMIEENQRIRQHGFIESELERYKKQTLRQLEKAYDERDKQESRNYASQYVSHFLNERPAPGIAYTYEFAQKHLPNITLAEINDLREQLTADENRALVVMAAEKEGVDLPAGESLGALIESIKQLDLEPYTEEAIAENLMEERPKAGQITAEETLESLGMTRLTFSNGLQAVLKPTDFKNDEILITATSPGGHTLYEADDFRSARFADQIIAESGLGELDNTALNKFLSDKQARISPYIINTSEGLNGNCSPKELELWLQMAHLYFTSPRKDEAAFQSKLTKDKMLYQNLASNPNYFFSDEVGRILSQDHPRYSGIPKPEDFDAVDLDRAFALYQDRFADASDFTFYFIGNFEVEAVKPLLAAYLGSLPALGRTESGKDLGIRPPKGMVSETVKRGQEQQSQVRMFFTGEAEYDEQENYLLQSLGELLSIKLIEELREEQSGVYGVNAWGYMQYEPYSSYTFTVSFPCGPESVEDLIQSTLDEIQKIQNKGPEEKDLLKVQEAQKRKHEVNLKENRFWLNYLRTADRLGQDPAKVLKYNQKVDALTATDLQAIAQKYLDTEHYIRVVLYPEE